ncbi:MAG: hypothetical protein IT209_01835 [Armatimonadetes bacterium]|nr:hypothetical protein [Armatimonadota bacterium]
MHSLDGKKVYLKFDSGKGGEGDYRIVSVEGGLMKVRAIDPDLGEEADAFWFPITHVFTIREKPETEERGGRFHDDILEAWSRLGDEEGPD